MKMKTIICCLFALSFFLVVAGRNMPSTLSPDVNFDDPPLHNFSPPPPPPSPFVNCDDVVSQTQYLSKPPCPVLNSDSESQNIKEDKFFNILCIILIVVTVVSIVVTVGDHFLCYD